MVHRLGGGEVAMKLYVDRSKCVGSGQCAQYAPDVFDQDPDNGLAILLAETPAQAEEAAARKAADLCPARAIRVVEA
jgi:ferredoxin